MKRVDAIQSLSNRVKRLESKLEELNQRGAGSRQAAAPSMKTEEWHICSQMNRNSDRLISSRACDLAAAVTEWWESEENNAGGDEYEQRLFDLVAAFVHGEPLRGIRNAQ